MKRRRLPIVAPALPPMRCDTHCGACCGPVPVDAAELVAILAYTLEHHIHPIDQGLTCAYFQRGTCQVYPVRPRVCRAYGHSDRLVCSRGYNVPVDDEAALNRWVLGEGKPLGLLSQLVLERDPLSG